MTTNLLLQPHIGAFKTESAMISSNDGTVTTPFSAVIHTGEAHANATVSIDNVAAIIDTYEMLTAETLATAYARAVEVKKFTKSPQQDDAPDGTNTEMTTFVVLARKSSLSLEAISDFMGRLNKTASSSLWPDMVAVLGQGIVNYTGRTLGADHERGDFFLPPDREGPRHSVVPMYVTKSLRGFGDFTFNKVVAFIIPRVAIYRIGIQLGNYNDLLIGATGHGAATETYQLDLNAELKPIPYVELIEQYMPVNVFEIVADGRTVMGTVQYQHWQDGGVLILRGWFPLEPFLLFLREAVPVLRSEDLRFMRESGFQISNSLPITKDDFLRTLHIFQARSSNLTIRKVDHPTLVQKLGDEGTQSPYVGRLMLGIFRLRDMLFSAEQRQKFNGAYEPLLSTLTSARDAAKDIVTTWRVHQAKIQSGAIVEVHGMQITITEDINRHLGRDLETFINAASRSMKQCMQNVVRLLGVDIGFLFKKENNFQVGLEALRESDSVLANYLEHTRYWLEPLMLVRNNMEHGLWSLPKIKYVIADKVTAKEPDLNGETISAFAERILDRTFCFAEEVIAHCIQRAMPGGITIYEAPVVDRDSNAPERFRLTIVPGGRDRWTLAPHLHRFEDV